MSITVRNNGGLERLVIFGVFERPNDCLRRKAVTDSIASSLLFASLGFWTRAL